MPLWTSILENYAKKKLSHEFYSEFMRNANIDPHDTAGFNAASRNAQTAYESYNGMKEGGGAPRKSYGGQGLTSGGFFSDLLATQYRAGRQNTDEFGTIDKTGSALGSIFKGPKAMLTQFLKLTGDEVLTYLGEQSELLTAINEKAGMTGELSSAFRTEIMNASPAVIRLGISFTEMTEAVSDVVAQSGKFKLLNKETIAEMALASKFTKDMGTFAAMGKDFEKVGLGVRDMSLLVEKMGMKSLTLGLNARTTTGLIAQHLKNLNQFGFKDGIEGLNRMAQKSIEFRMNMESVFKMAEKVWEPDKALDLVANLQIIGGAFGDLNDPIKLMYMATNNVEGLQDAINGAAQSLVTYNEEQGRFAVTGVNLRRAKVMAEELGITMEELTNNAVAGAERAQAKYDLMGSGLKMDEEEMEFLTNLARMEDGKMVIEVPEPLRKQLGMVGEQTTIAVDELRADQANLLLENKKAFEKMSMQDIARHQVTLIENIERDLSFLRAVARVSVGNEIGDAIEELIGMSQGDMSVKLGEYTNWVKSKMDIGDAAFREFMDKAVPDIKRMLGLTEENGKSIIEEIKPLVTEVTKQKGEINTGAKNNNINDPLKLMYESNKVPTTISPNVERKVIDVNINPMAASMDQVARIFWSDPRWQDEFKKGFLSPNSN